MRGAHFRLDQMFISGFTSENEWFLLLCFGGEFELFVVYNNSPYDDDVNIQKCRGSVEPGKFA